MLKRRIEIPHSRGVIFRKTYPELYNNHIVPLLTKFPALRQYYNSTNKEIIFPNHSVLMFRYCQYERDLSNHQGVEYHDLGIEEVGEWPENWFWTLKGSNRSSIPGISPRCALTGNPGGIGHKWLKRIFIDRAFREFENPKDFAFILSRLWDNPMLQINDPGYENRLRSNKNPQLVKAYVDGSWDIMAGQFFENVSRETHLFKPFDIPDHWIRSAGFDTGYNHPAFFVWLASDTDGNVYAYREYCKAKKRTEEIVSDLLKFPDTVKIQSIAAGHDCWAKQQGSPSVDEKFTEASSHKLTIHRANIDRIHGAGQLRDYLVLRDDGTDKPKPRLRIFENCPILFDCLIRMTHDPDRPEDVLKVDAEDGDPYTGDDPYDGTRYAIMDSPRISVDPEKPKRRKYYEKGDEDYTETPWNAV